MIITVPVKGMQLRLTMPSKPRLVQWCDTVTKTLAAYTPTLDDEGEPVAARLIQELVGAQIPRSILTAMDGLELAILLDDISNALKDKGPMVLMPGIGDEEDVARMVALS